MKTKFNKENKHSGLSKFANIFLITNNYQDFFATVGAGLFSTNDGTSNSLLSLFDSGISGTSIENSSNTEVTNYWGGLIPASSSGELALGFSCNNWMEGEGQGVIGRLPGTGATGLESALNDNRVGIVFFDSPSCSTEQAYLCVAYLLVNNHSKEVLR